MPLKRPLNCERFHSPTSLRVNQRKYGQSYDAIADYIVVKQGICLAALTRPSTNLNHILPHLRVFDPPHIDYT
ncbi:Hypothetical protein SMAX5B_016916 [Scophthalmus maximus]|uniref:Uncharacterized protein n=1 Tax=Scophthalmus maximus TaxID=52904 RepID=A0A2U9CL16_SCOMX|nr:Hypothetical protein SMAX5B_016916 [Scophthalmus maximus]